MGEVEIAPLKWKKICLHPSSFLIPDIIYFECKKKCLFKIRSHLNKWKLSI